MYAIKLSRDSGRLAAQDVDLAASHGSGVMDPTGYRRRAAGEEPKVRPGAIASSGVRLVTLSEHANLGALLRGAVGLVFVSEGQIEITLPNGRVVPLGRGTLLVIEDPKVDLFGAKHSAGTRLVHVGITEPLRQHPRETAVEAGGADEAPPNFQVMYRDKPGVDGVSYFREFDQLFAGEADEWSPTLPVIGVQLANIDQDAFIDWHPEVTNNLVLVTRGSLELEVSGDNAVETFRAGDIVLAADITGKGHIDRFAQSTSLVVPILEHSQLWAPTAADVA
jgi:hypothetical protein